VRSQHLAGDSHTADLVRRNCGIGTGFEESFSEFQIGTASDDANIRIPLPRKYGDDQVLLVTGQHADEAPGAIDPQFFEHISVGGVTDYIQHSPVNSIFIVHKALDMFLVVVNHYVRTLGSLEFIDRVAAGVSESTDDVVVLELADSLKHLTSPKDVGDLAFHEESSHHREHVQHDHHAEDDHENVEYPQQGVVRGIDDLGVAHAGESDDRHVEGVEEGDRGSAQDSVAGYADCQDDEKKEKRTSELSAEFHLGPAGTRKWLNSSTEVCGAGLGRSL